MQATTDILLWFAAMVSGLMTGVYFAFSTFVMRALCTIDRAAGMAAMKAINAVIVRTLFLPLFILSSIAALALAAIGAAQWGAPGSAPMTLAAAAYLAGMTLVTMTRNVPLNNRLAAADPASDAGALVWSEYLSRWTRWNHVRTLASAAALAMFVQAIAVR